MYQTIVFLPLLGFLIAGIFGSFFSARFSELVTSTFVSISAVLSWVAFLYIGIYSNTEKIILLDWINSGGLQIAWALRIDTLTAVMLVVVNSVSALVHIYSIGYMHDDPHRPRFFAYLSLFTFAMLMLVTSDNLLQMFFGWEGVGLASYLLIGFWYTKPAANAAAIKAFLVNRVGDFGFTLGIFAIIFVFGTIDMDYVFANAASFQNKSLLFLGIEWDLITIICLLLFMGAMGKSAQLFLHTWLPDAMEGPTPVSALIHAATMVTAGVFLVARMSPMFELSSCALTVVTFIGASTAIFAATIGLVQNDIKRVIAYSTCSQLGYMFAALGVGAYQAGIFHLFTHAFFKALLFLGAGSVIHALSNEQDMRKMGGVFKKIPATYTMMIVGTLALTGFPLTAGYFSKDAIIEAAFSAHSWVGTYAFVATVIAALFTSFYSWRLIFMTFHGKTRAEKEVYSHIHESPLVMMIPLLLLAAGAIFAGITFKDYFIGDAQSTFWSSSIFTLASNNILEELHQVPIWVVYSPMVMMITGFITAYILYIYKPCIPSILAGKMPGLYQFLLNKWYFDELYDYVFVEPAKRLGYFLWKIGDGYMIDGFGPDGVSAGVLKATYKFMKMQSGYIYHYAFGMIIGLFILVSFLLLSGGN